VNAIGYVRRSKEQVKVVSLEAQESIIARYCESHGLALAAIVVHDGVSGGKRTRFTAIENKRLEVDAKALVFYDLDRLARDCPGMLAYIESIMRQGCELHEATLGRLDYSTAEGIFMTQVRGAMNEFQRNITGRKTSHALQYLRAQGLQYTRVPPFGYEYREGRLVPNPTEQEAIHIITQCAIAGHGARRALRALHAVGYQGRMGLTTLHRLIASIKTKLPANYFAAM
jgi:site-specific DNA recombinase